MATPPPTETPAPLSEEMFEVAVMLAEMGAALTQTGQSNESTALIFKASVALKAGSATIASLTEQVAALTAERDGAHKNGYREGYEAGCAKDVAEVESRLARHVAALQEIGRGVEEDQATIARLREAMALIAQCLEGSKYKSNMEGRAYGIASQTVAALSSKW